MTVDLHLGFVPLVDAAPLLVADVLGFAEEEGLHFVLHAAPSWANLRDLVAMGQVAAAQMLAPVPIAMALGLGRGLARFEALSVLNINGNVIGVSRAIAGKMRAAGYGFDFKDAFAAGHAILAASQHRASGCPLPFRCMSNCCITGWRRSHADWTGWRS